MAGRLVTIGQYPHVRRCPSTWWTPPPSKRLERVIPVRRVRFPSTSANAEVARNREERSDGSRPPPRMRKADDPYFWTASKAALTSDVPRKSPTSPSSMLFIT